MKTCPFCQSQLAYESQLTGNLNYIIRCQSCGSFEISEECFDYSDAKKKIEDNANLIAGLLRLMRENGEKAPLITALNIDQLLADPRIPPLEAIQQKAERILDYIRKRTTFFGQKIPFDFEKESPVSFSRNKQEAIALTVMLIQQNLLERDSAVSSYASIAPLANMEKVWLLALTSKAFEKFSLGTIGNKVFVACHFSKDHEKYIQAICAGIHGAKLQDMCLYNEIFSEPIMDKALAEIQESKYVVVDLTNRRRSVSLEAGYALALKKEIIFVAHDAEKQSEAEFYSGHYKINFYSNEIQLTEIITNALMVYKARENR